MIYFLGDVHGRFDHLVDVVRTDRPKAVVFVGDLDCTRPLDEEIAEIRDLTEVWYIPGNHDSDRPEYWENLTGPALRDRNLHGRVVEIAGRRIAGLGGVFRGEIWLPPGPPAYRGYAEWFRSRSRSNQAPPKGGDPAQAGRREAKAREQEREALRHRSTIFPEVYEALAKARADILVTHEAPGSHPHGFEALDRLARSLGVGLLVHGHHHDAPDYRPFELQAGFRMIGVGLRGITREDGTKVLAGERDDARFQRRPNSPDHH